MKLGGKLALLAPLIVVATLMGVVCFHHNLFTSIASRGDTTSKRDITDRPIWGRGPEETVDRFEPDSPGQGIAVELQRDLVVTEEKAQGSMDRFLELAQARFLERVGRPSTKADENWSFNHIQLIRVPKAASTAASAVARTLVGCSPPGPCCVWGEVPVGSCPARGLDCSHKVTGCWGHRMGPERKGTMQNSKVFSMSSVRDVTARLVSGFFYAAPHSPECARNKNVDYTACFRHMVERPMYQNVAARMFAGYYAYDHRQNICLKSGQRCSATLDAVIASACDLNFIMVSEAWKSSILLLFETLPWIAPSKAYLPVTGKSQGGADVGRRNTERRYEEGLGNVTTPELMDLAKTRNAVDVQLHEFITAMFCNRLRVLGLINHSLVVEELVAFKSLGGMCYDESNTQATLARFRPFKTTNGEKCRLFQPLAREHFL